MCLAQAVTEAAPSGIFFNDRSSAVRITRFRQSYRFPIGHPKLLHKPRASAGWMPTAGLPSRPSTEDQSNAHPSKTSSCDSLLFCPFRLPVGAMRSRKPQTPTHSPRLRRRSGKSEHELCRGHSDLARPLHLGSCGYVACDYPIEFAAVARAAVATSFYRRPPVWRAVVRPARYFFVLRLRSKEFRFTPWMVGSLLQYTKPW